jgi:hypothetical protein
MTKTNGKVQPPEYLPPSKISSLFLTSAEIGLADKRLDHLELCFRATCDAFFSLEKCFANAKTAKGSIPESTENGLIWQRNRAFLVAITQLKACSSTLRNQMFELKLADAVVRPLSFNANANLLVASNLRCAYEIHDAAAALCVEVEFFLAETETAAWRNAAIDAIEHLRHPTPGFNRNLVLAVASLDGDTKPRYTTGGALFDTPPDNPRLSNWDLEKAIELVGAREFNKGMGWVAVHNPERGSFGPKQVFRNGVRLRDETTNVAR